MHIDIAAASPNDAPATRTRVRSAEAPAKGERDGSFADLLTAAGRRDENFDEPAAE